MIRSPKSRSGPVPKSPPKGPSRGAHGAIPPAVLAALADGPRECRDLVQALPWASEIGVHAALRRMKEAGQIVREGRGLYGLAPAADPQADTLARRARPLADVRTHIVGLGPGRVVGYEDICAGLGVTRGTAARAFRDLEAGGYIVRIASGRYARAGAGEAIAPDDDDLPRYAQVARIMAPANSVWSNRSLQAALKDPVDPREAKWVVEGMYREGWVERPRRGEWRLTAVGRALFSPSGRFVDPSAAVLDVLSPGAVHHLDDVVSATGLTHQEAGHVLDRLEAEGHAVHVIYGHWRAASTAASLCPGARSQRAQALAVLLTRDQPCSAHALGEDLGMDRMAYLDGVAQLVQEGIAVRIRQGLCRLDERWRTALLSRLGAEGRRAALTVPESLALKPLRHAGPLDALQASEAMSLDATSARACIAALLEKRRLREVAPRTYLAA